MALKIGIVGMGGIGHIHAKCYKEDPLAELVAVCDVIKEKADSAAEKFGVKAYYSLKDMLANEDIDIVDVTTGGYENGSWHFEPTMQALEAGKHVLCEKPLSNDINEARQMVAEASKRNLYFGCNLNHSFTQTSDKARQYMKEGAIGELVYCLHKVGFNGGDYTYALSKAGRSYGLPYFHTKAFLSHPFSLMMLFCGEVTHVQAFFDRPGVRRTASDVMLSINSIHVRFANGAVGYLLSQRGDAMYGLGGWWSFEVAGTKGTFCIENCVEKISYWRAPQKGEKANAREGSEPEVLNTGITDFSNTFPARIHAFLEDITNKVPREMIRASGRDALATLEYTFAAMRSYEEGGILVRPEPLPPIHGDPRYVMGIDAAAKL